MGLFRKIYTLTLLEGGYQKILFWGSLVLLNAMVGSCLAYADYSLIGMIMGILIWGSIYIQFGSRGYQAIGKKGYYTLQKSIFIAYLIKTIISLVGIFYCLYGGFFTIGIGIIPETLEMIIFIPEAYASILVALIGSTLGIDFFFSDLDFNGVSYTLYLTVTHGFTMSLLILLFGLLIYPIVRVISGKKESSNTYKD